MESLPDGASGAMLLFRLQHQRYGVRARDVREVLRAAAIAVLPGAPAVVEGVVDVRGELVPVLNLRRRFGLPERALAPDERFLLVRAGGRTAAFRVDAVDRLEELAGEGDEEMRAAVPGAEHIAGIVRTSEGVVLIHDPAAFLSQAEAERLSAALAARVPP